MWPDGFGTHETWRKIFLEKGHTPILNEDGDVDCFVLEEGFHNGPGCSKCGFSGCWHCDPSGKHIPECEGG